MFSLIYPRKELHVNEWNLHSGRKTLLKNTFIIKYHNRFPTREKLCMYILVYLGQ